MSPFTFDSFLYYSPSFPCMPDGGRAGTGGADFDISIARESKVKPTMRPLKMGPKNGEPFRSLPLTG
jgi:hypothetical protein